jgi:hypothetical protein
MFLWVTCPEGVNTNELMREALLRKVLFVPGQDFFPDAPGQVHAPELLQCLPGTDSGRHRAAGGGLQGCGAGKSCRP